MQRLINNGVRFNTAVKKVETKDGSAMQIDRDNTCSSLKGELRNLGCRRHRRRRPHIYRLSPFLLRAPTSSFLSTHGKQW
eukprot:7572954-Heterocapsa_arctica.AAC.1